MSASTSIINNVMDAVCDLIDALGLFALIKRGALGTGNGLSCGLAPTSPDEVYFDKNQTITLDFTINGKHDDLQTLSDAMNKIHEELTKKTSYPDGNGWQITDIQTITFPQQIGREDNNAWLMASSLGVRFSTYTRNNYTPPETVTPSEETSEETTEDTETVQE